MGTLPDLAAFRRHVGETFRMQVAADRAVDLDLVEARAGRPSQRPATPPDRPFSLLFRSRGPASLPQRTYRLDHPSLGTFDLFLVPLGPEGGGMRFEAVFN